MRNLGQYPITHEEKISALKSAIETIMAEGKLGDIRPAALREVIADMEARSSKD